MYRRKVVGLLLGVLVLLTGTVTAVVLIIRGISHRSVSSALSLGCEDRLSALLNGLRLYFFAPDVHVALFDIYPTEAIWLPSFYHTYIRYTAGTSTSLVSFQRFVAFQHVLLLDRAQFQQTIGKNISEIEIFSPGNFTFFDAPTQPEYYPVLYFSVNTSLASNLTGWDWLDWNLSPLTETGALETVNQSKTFISSAGFASTSTVTFSLVIIAPIAATPAQAAAEPGLVNKGLIMGVAAVGDIVNHAFSDRNVVGMIVNVRDQRKNDTVVYKYNPLNNTIQDTVSPAYSSGDFDSSSWTLECHASAEFVKQHHVAPVVTAVILTAVVIGYCALAWFIVSNARKKNAVEKLVHERTNELVRRTNELAILTQEAMKQDERKSAFLSFLCHELRNPLHVMVSMVDFLRGSRMTPEQASLVKSLSTSVELMSTLVNDLLDIPAMNSGHIALELREFVVRELVDTVTSGIFERCVQKGLQLSCLVDDDVPLVVLGDPTRVAQILHNFLSNAVKFTSAGEVRVHVGLADRVPGDIPFEDPVWLVLSVQDTGVGIAREAQKSLFIPYSQEKLSIMREYGGTGLGLAIVKQLATEMYGRVAVQSTVGQGSTFSAIICCGAVKTAVPSRENSSRPSHLAEPPVELAEVKFVDTKAQSEGQELHGMRVLYADDHPVNLKLMSRFVQGAGVELYCVENGLDVIRSVRRSVGMASTPVTGVTRMCEEPFDAVLLDVNMPIMDGLEAAEILKEAFPDMPVVAITANLIGVQSNPGLFIKVLGKPVRREQVLTTLRDIRRAHRCK